MKFAGKKLCFMLVLVLALTSRLACQDELATNEIKDDLTNPADTNVKDDILEGINLDTSTVETDEANTIGVEGESTTTTLETTTTVETSTTTEEETTSTTTEETTTPVAEETTAVAEETTSEVTEEPTSTEISSSTEPAQGDSTSTLPPQDEETSTPASSSSKKSNSDWSRNTLDISNYLSQDLKIIVQPSQVEEAFDVRRIMSKYEDYEILMKIQRSPSARPLSFKKCPIAIDEENFDDVLSTKGKCIESFAQIHKSKFRLIVKPWLLPANTTFAFRVVISGCSDTASANTTVLDTKDSNNQTIKTFVRDVDMRSGEKIPSIYHNTEAECVYRVRNHDNSQFMTRTTFSLPEHSECDLVAKMSSADNENTLIGRTRASFDSHHSVEPLATGVYDAKPYLIFRAKSCKRNLKPIAITVNPLKKSYKLIEMGQSNSREILESAKLMTAKDQSNMLAEIVTADSRDMVEIQLDRYEPQDRSECDASSLKSILSIYAFDAFGQMTLKQYDCRNYPGSGGYKKLTFRGHKAIFVQFYHDSHLATADEFKLTLSYLPVQKLYQVLTTPRQEISSDALSPSLLANSQIDYEIRAPAGHRIVLTIHNFTNGQALYDTRCLANDQTRMADCLVDCRDTAYAQIRLNSTQPSFDNSFELLQDESTKICHDNMTQKSYYSFTNRIGVSFAYASRVSSELSNPSVFEPFFRFSFTFEKICDNIYKEPRHENLLFDSSKSPLKSEVTCANTISAPRSSRVVVYKTSWPGNTVEPDDHSNQDIRPFGHSLCQESDYLSISDSNPKYTSASPSNEIYCSANPLSAFSSKSSKLFLSYVTRRDRSANSFVSEMGYFSYRYLYTEPTGEFSVNFAEIVPENVNANATLSSIQFKIELSADRYLVPLVTSCKTQLAKGDAQILFNNHRYSFQRVCTGLETLIGGTGASQMTFEFVNVNLSELRENEIGFAVEYRSHKRVLDSPEGASFSVPSFSELRPLNKKEEQIRYEWQINLPPKCYVRLNVDELSLKKQDGVDIFDLQSSNPSTLTTLKAADNTNPPQPASFLFALSRLSVRLHVDYARLAGTKLNMSYLCEPRVRVLDETRPSGELTLDKTRVQSNLEWMIMAPKNYFVEVKIIDQTTGPSSADKFDQLKFSVLETGYSSPGYYHYNLRSGMKKPEDRQTDIILSKENSLRVEYLPVLSDSSFKLVYTMVPRVLTAPFGVIQQRFNNLAEPAVPVPRPTDQTWIIRAPYGKRIAITPFRIDLPIEDTCSTAKISIAEANGHEIANLCGNFVSTDDASKLASGRFESKSNELRIRFTTQDLLQASFSEEDGQPMRAYTGFELGYEFVQPVGDCYFQSDCGFKLVNLRPEANPKWSLIPVPGSSFLPPKTKVPETFAQLYQANMVMVTSFPSGLSKPLAAVLQTPTVSRTKRFVKFDYALEGPELTSSQQAYSFQVRLVRPIEFAGEGDAPQKVLEDNTILAVNLTKTRPPRSQLHSMTIPLGKYIFSDYQLVFWLDKPEGQVLSQQVVLKLDNVQFMEHDVDCSSAEVSRLREQEDDLQVCDSQNSLQETFEVEDDDEEKKLSGSPALVQKQQAKCQNFVPACESSQCSKAGTELCVNNPDALLTGLPAYECKCRVGFKGTLCDEKIDPCKSKELNECAANSTCINGGDLSSDDPAVFLNYTCQCAVNQAGRFCQERLAPCKSLKNADACNQLKGQGRCVDKATVDEPDHFVCECAPLFAGKNCEREMDPSKKDCSAVDEICRSVDSEARCEDSPHGPVCICSPGFEGDSCQVNVNDCQAAVNPCHNNGTCVDGVNKFTCQCSKGYTGVFCEVPEICSKCKPEGTFYCESGPKPVNSTGGSTSDKVIEYYTPRCVCQPTHTGALCDRLVDPCARKGICGQGVCVSNKTSTVHRCVCPVGFKGNRCDEPESPCDRGVCLNGARCQMKPDGGQYECECPKGFSGRHCETPEDKCKPNPCKNEAECYSQVRTASNGKKSVGYVCDCPPGFHGVNCEKLVDNCANKCPFGAKCESIPPNDFRCECPKGRYGRRCEFTVDLCIDNRCSSGACRPLPIEMVTFDDFGKAFGPASNGNRPYTCKCFDGFEGELCNKQRDHCKSSPCVNGTCVNLLSGYECICPQNQTGVNCAQTNFYCSDELMKCNKTNTHYCENYDGGSICHCNRGYTGARCETPIHICELDSPCISGTCVKNPKNPGDVNDYLCVGCMQGYEGRNCSDMIDFCKRDNPCRNGAECHPKLNGYYCKCSDKFSGQNCTEPAQCQLNNCQNESTCEAKADGGYVCRCADNYQGRFCEQKKSPCKKKCPMGECDPATGECRCSKDFSFCPDKYKCSTHQCSNGGSCIETIADNTTLALVPKCICPPGFTGEKCEKTIHCMDLVESCGPNAKACHIVTGGYECECKEKFFGARCNETAQELTEKLLTETIRKMEAEERHKCSFGVSKESKLFLGITAITILIIAAIGFMIGRWVIVSYKKKLNRLDKVMSVSTHSLMHSMGYDPSSQMSNSVSRMTNASASVRSPGSNSSHSFLIPRPNILPTPKP